MSDTLLILALILATLFATLLGCLHSSLATSSSHEVKQRARTKQQGARGAYVLHGRGYEAIVSLILLRVLLSVIVVSIVVHFLALPWSILVATLLLSATTEIIGRFYLRDFALRQMDWLLPILQKLLIVTLPLSRPIGHLLDSRFAKRLPVIHNRDHLLEILETHKESAFSDIESEQIEIVRHALGFGDKKIRDVMTPKSAVVTVSANTSVGPVVIDELHKSGFSRFPVWEGKDTNIIGTLFLRDLINLKEQHGRIKEYTLRKVYYVHEELPLGHALQAFLKTRHHLFVVVNNFEEFVGIITLEDIIEQIIGKQVIDEFDDYENPREVAALRAKKVHAKTEHPMVE